MNIDSKRNIIFIITGYLLLSLIAGLIVISALPEFPWSDQLEYDQIAINLVKNHAYTEINGNLYSPGYPFFLAISYALFGLQNYTAVYLVQFILQGAVGAMVFLIARRHLHLTPLYSLLSGITVSLWPYLMLYSALLLTETLFVFLVSLFIFGFMNFMKDPSPTNGLTAGLALGLATLTRPIPLLLPIWIAFWLFIVYKFIKLPIIDYKNNLTIKSLVYHAITTVAVFAFIIAPWIIYSSLHEGKLTPVNSTISEVFNMTNKSFSYEWSAFKTPGYEPGSEFTWGKIALVKFKNIFRFWSSGARGYQADMLVEKYPVAKYLIAAYRIFYFLLLALAFSSWLFVKRQKQIILLWLIILYFWLFHITLHTSPRFTLPVIPLVILLAFVSFRYYGELLISRHKNVQQI